MLKGLLEEIRKYDSILKAEKADFESKKLQYGKTYGNGEKYQEVMQRTKEAHVQALHDAKQSFMKKVDSIYADIDKKIVDYVTKPVSEDFAATLTVISAMGGNITEDEARMYYDKYKDNYTARKALSNVLNGVGGIDKYQDVLRSHQYVKEVVEYSRQLVKDFVKFGDESYQHLLLLVENNNPLDACGTDISRFLGGEVVIDEE